ncbi:hypothetical protein [Sphingosinithalassobacter sp. LHW66-3]
MSRSLVVLIVVLLLLVVGLFLLSSRDTSTEPVRVEKVVSLENLTQ